MPNITELVEKFEHALLSVDRMTARQVLDESSENLDSGDMPDKIITPALERIGKKWETGEVALSQVYMSGIICEELLNALLPPKDIQPENKARIAIVTFEDHHILGKRIVQSVLKSAGLMALDYGQGIQADALAEKVKTDHTDILLISTLMFPSALHIKDFKEKIDSMGINIKIGVGGAPFRFDENLWKQVGADAMGRTAADAVAITRKWLEEIS